MEFEACLSREAVLPARRVQLRDLEVTLQARYVDAVIVALHVEVDERLCVTPRDLLVAALQELK